ncbi:sensor histidine kinase [Halarcobacter bivalviorum]|uniref:sensor histidine kinase n=1 Tax=Halarcobacter bivalviorum TaxID=663364 RepID=UPI0013E92983|nr:HAMP domain-containing sensor histidine kinase [Halarcobacter bivalviorum]
MKTFDDDFIVLSIEKKELFFIFIVFANIILLLLFTVVIQSINKMILISRIKRYRKKLRKNYYEYRRKLKELGTQSKLKDRVIFEQSKQKSLNSLISNIAHHWRQPLSVVSIIATSMQLYEEEDLVLEEIVRNSKTINENIQYLSNILDEFSQNIKENRNLKKEVFRLDFMLNEFVVNNDSPDIKIELEMLDTYSLYTYKNELFKALYNIINNSKEKLSEREIKKKKIYIDVYEADKNIIIKIKDTAEGIEEDILNNIFEPYITTKFKTRDVGLGLYLSYMIITEQLKGTISVENITFTDKKRKEEYKGAQFLIKIPRSSTPL